MIYNEEQKKRYIEEVRNRYSEAFIINMGSVFNRSGEMEAVLKKDVCDFSREEISELYAMLMYANRFTYSSVNSKLASYVDWCMDNMLVRDGCNHFREFQLADFDQYINSRIIGNTYITRYEMEEFIRELPNSRDRFLLLCVFEFGKSDNFKDIFLLKLSDIDKANLKANLPSGKVVSVSSLLVRLAEEADATNTYTQTSGHDRRLMESEYIVKRLKTSTASDPDNNNKQNVKLMSKVIKSAVDIAGVNSGINTTSLALSGQFEMIRRRSAELGIEKIDYVRNYWHELEAQYYMSPPQCIKYLAKYAKYL